MRIKYNSLMYLMMIIPIFEPDIFKCFPFTDRLFLFMKIVAAIIATYQYIKICKRPRFGWLIIIYGMTLLLSTLWNSQNIVFCFNKIIELLVGTMIIEFGITKMGIKSITILYYYLSLLMVIQLLLCIPFPNGLLSSAQDSENYKVYFLGIKNGFISWAILLCTCGLISFFSLNNEKLKKSLFIQFIIISINILIIKSSTAIIVCFIYIIIISFVILKHRRLNLYKLTPWMIIIYFLVVIFRIQEYFDAFFETVFNKSSSFTGRTVTWDAALSFIKLKPLYGYGIREVEVIQTAYGRGYSAHNFFLYLLLCGGIVSFSLVTLMFGVIIIKSHNFRTDYLESVLSLAILAFFIATLTESGIYTIRWFVLFTLFGNLELLSKSNTKKYLRPS